MVFRALSSIFFPRRCAGCGEVLFDEETFVCRKCVAGLQPTEEGWHRGNKLEQLFRGFNPYKKETGTSNKFVRGAAFLFYGKTSAVPEIIHTMKFLGDPELARWLGHRAAEYLSSHNSGFFSDIDLLMPVALHPLRQQERGFNQSEWLCRGIAEVTGLPIDTTHLVRTVNTEQQSRKTLAERASLGQIFALIRPEDLRGKHILVVDDVCTTGSTISRVLDVLHPVHGCRYSVFALTYAIH